MFDTVYVSREVLGAFPFACRACGRMPEPDDDWQTWSLRPGLDSYFDGVALEVRSEPPRHELGFLDNSGGLDPW